MLYKGSELVNWRKAIETKEGKLEKAKIFLLIVFSVGDRALQEQGQPNYLLNLLKSLKKAERKLILKAVFIRQWHFRNLRIRKS